MSRVKTFIMYRITNLTLFAAAMLISLSAAAQHNVKFDSGWSFSRGGKTKNVTLPYAWNQSEAFKVHIEKLSTDTVRYTKVFKVPSAWRGKKVFIEFEGARQCAVVFLNGRQIAMHENGVMAFGVDLTQHLVFGKENRLEVLTDNDWKYKEKSTRSSFQWNDKNFNANYGGLPKHVRIHVLDKVYQTLPLYSSLGTVGTYVYARGIDVDSRKADICVESEVMNETDSDMPVKLVCEVYDKGRMIKSFSTAGRIAKNSKVVLKAESPVANLNFWSWGYGYLYDVKTKIVSEKGAVLDEQTIRTGFRKTDFHDGITWLNNRAIMVHGFAQRTSNEWPGVGMSVPAWLSDYSNSLMVRSGGNLVRWMHVCPWKQDVESCDRVGLMQAMPAGDAEKDVSDRRWEHRIELMKDAIVYNRNNPSIIFYECGNKGISEEHMKQMLEIRNRFDPNGGRAIGSREMLSNKTVAEYGGEMLYINKSATKPVWAMEYSRDEGLRRYWDDWSFPYHKSGDGPLYRNSDASAYNLNQDQLAVEHVRRWYYYWLERPGTGERVSNGGVKIIFSDTNTHNRGESNYRTSGIVDAMRLPKDSYYAHQVMWNGWITPDSSQTYIMGHWNYQAETVKPVYVVSDAPSVKLFVNGREIEGGRNDYHFLYTFDNVKFEAGEIKAVSYDEAGRELSSYSLKTAGKPHHIRLTTMTDARGFKADGADMAMIEVEVVDKDGNRCPLANNKIRFSLKGAAEWCGGLAKDSLGTNCVGSQILPVECGVNRVLLRSTTNPGRIVVSADADGLGKASCVLKTVKPTDGSSSSASAMISTTDNKSTTVPFTMLRGETPSTPSYRQIFRTVKIADVVAGCSQSTARYSIDDNEETEWKNDGLSSTAWITYKFAKPEVVRQVVAKFTGWRKRKYPIEVYADSTLVWKGETPTSLGYVHLELNPKESRSITIRLKGAAANSDAFGQIVELAAPVANELDLFKAKDGDKVKNELRIVECDLLADK